MRRLFSLRCLAVLVFIGVAIGDGGRTSAAQSSATPSPTSAASAVVPTGLPVISAENAAHLKPVARLGRGTVGQVYWSPDGQTLAVTSSIGVWLYAAGQLDAPPHLLAAPTRCTRGAFSADGTRFAASDVDGIVRVWDTRTGAQQLSLKTNAATWYDPVVSPYFDHQAGTHSVITCYAIAGVAWSPDGKTLASGSDQSVILWNAQTGSQTAALKFDGGASLIAFSLDGQRLAASNGDANRFTLGLFDVRTRALRKTWTEAVGPSPTMLSFSPDGSTVIYSTSGLLGWPVKGSTPPRSLADASVQTNVTLNPDLSRFAFGDPDGLLHLWSTKTHQPLTTIKAHGSVVQSVAWSPDGKRLASSSLDQTVRIWDAQTGRALAALDGYEPAIRTIAFSPDGQTLAVSSDRGPERIDLWTIRTGSRLRTFYGDTVWTFLTRLAFSPDGAALATGFGVLDVKTGQPLDRWPQALAAFSPDGLWLAELPAGYGSLILWDARTQTKQTTLATSENMIWDLVFSPDGAYLASCTGMDRDDKIWTVASGAVKPIPDSCYAGAIAFSPNSQTLAIGSAAGNLHVWDVKSGTLRMNVASGETELKSVQFTHDGRLLISAGIGGDPLISVWDLGTGTRLKALSSPSGFVGTTALSADGTLLASAGDDGTIFLWGVQ